MTQKGPTMKQDIDQTAADIVERLRTRAAKIKGYITSSQIVVDLLAPQMKPFNDRYGHDIYTVRMSVDHQSSIRTQSKELRDLEEAAAEIEALRAREAELVHDLERQMTIANTECRRAEELHRKLDEAVKALTCCLQRLEGNWETTREVEMVRSTLASIRGEG